MTGRKMAPDLSAAAPRAGTPCRYARAKASRLSEIRPYGARRRGGWTLPTRSSGDVSRREVRWNGCERSSTSSRRASAPASGRTLRSSRGLREPRFRAQYRTHRQVRHILARLTHWLDTQTSATCPPPNFEDLISRHILASPNCLTKRGTEQHPVDLSSNFEAPGPRPALRDRAHLGRPVRPVQGMVRPPQRL